MRTHGGNIWQLARQAAVAESAIIDFSASINPLGPPDCVRPLINSAIDSIVHYPDPHHTELVSELCNRHGLTPDSFVVGNGSSELFYAIARAVPFSRAVIPVPSYSDYQASVACAGKPFVQVPLEESASFKLTMEVLDGYLSGGELVFIGQPNNPTGQLVDRAVLLDFIKEHPSVIFVVDEAFADFVDGYISLANRSLDNLVVIRSLTKFYAIPGLRIGYAVAFPEVAKRIREQLPPWTLNTFAQKVAPVILRDTDYAEKTVRFIARMRNELERALAKLPGITVLPGCANFFLVRIDRSGLNADKIAELLIKDKLAIRVCTSFSGLSNRYFRVAVKSEQENALLVNLLKAILSGTYKAKKTPKKVPALMVQGTSSNAGKSILTAALCRIMTQDGIAVAPFKAQNMSLNSFVTLDGYEMGRAQVVQAQGCRREPDMRMNPVLLKPNSDTGSQVIVKGKPVGNMNVHDYISFKPQAFAAVRECYDSLAQEVDCMILEGAGSPAEVNLKHHDIVNMAMAEYADAKVLLVGDIDRGGVFASFIGTMEVLTMRERAMVAGYVVNRFRGNPDLLASAYDYMLLQTGKPVLGTVPYLKNIGLPEEDSVEFKSMNITGGNGMIEIALVDLPHISNFTDVDALRNESCVRLTKVMSLNDIGTPDVIILPGSKNVIGDMEYLRKSGIAGRILDLCSSGKIEIAGICGGFQMLGIDICDPDGVESSERMMSGLGILDLSTVYAPEKMLKRRSAVHLPSGTMVTGYEIHHGRTSSSSLLPIIAGEDGEPLGYASCNQRVWGTYLHGIFDEDAFRHHWIRQIAARKGVHVDTCTLVPYSIEPALDRLALAVRETLDLQAIYSMLGIR